MDTLQIQSTIRDALRLMDTIGIGLVTVSDAERRVLGVISDGDIRRALLKGFSLDDAISGCVNRNFIWVKPGTDRAAVLDLLQARRIRQIPIIDGDGRLAGMHTLEQIVGAGARDNVAVIMAGGRGERLRPITEHLPKPMIHVAGRPILERIILHLVSHGIRKIFISVNYMADIIEDYFRNGEGHGCRIEYLREKEPLGSGGSLSLLPIQQKPIVVMNGDLVTNTDIGGMIDLHQGNRFFATIGVRPYQHKIPFGCVELGNDNTIARLEEKPLVVKNVNAGIYVLSPEALATIPTGRFFPITDLFETALKNGIKCGCFQVEDEWIDIGMMSELGRARGL